MPSSTSHAQVLDRALAFAPGQDAAYVCPAAKGWASHKAVRHARDAVLGISGAGDSDGTAVERLYRSAKITQMCEGAWRFPESRTLRGLLTEGARR